MSKPDIAAIFWDNDGVLVDTEHLFFEACRHVLAEHEIELPLETFIDISLAQGRSCFDLLALNGADAEIVGAAKRARDEHYRHMLRDGVALIDGVRDTLDTLHESRAMAIVTSCNPDHFALIHRQTQILDYFEFVLAAGDYERHKPHPEPYLAAAERLSLRPEQCLVIEDSERGVRAAVAAGMPCLAIPTSLTRGAQFPGARAVLASVREIVNYL